MPAVYFLPHAPYWGVLRRKKQLSTIADLEIIRAPYHHVGHRQVFFTFHMFIHINYQKYSLLSKGIVAIRTLIFRIISEQKRKLFVFWLDERFITIRPVYSVDSRFITVLVDYETAVHLFWWCIFETIHVNYINNNHLCSTVDSRQMVNLRQYLLTVPVGWVVELRWDEIVLVATTVCYKKIKS